MIRLAMGALLLLGACSDGGASEADTPGARIERTAFAAGLIEDDAADLTGVYTSESDRVCLSAAGKGYRIGASVDYGPGNVCAAAGNASGREKLMVDLGDGCRFSATVAQGRLTFEAVLPTACERRCVGRASLAALEADRLSGSASEAAAFHTSSSGAPCS